MYGPSHPRCAPEERPVHLAELRALCRVLAGPAASEAVDALSAAMAAPDDDDRLAAAEQALDSLPSKPRRRVLASFAALRREAVDVG